MRFLIGLVIGALIGGAVGVAGGYNHGRGAPIFSNPFVEHDPVSKFERSARELIEETRRAIHDATR